MHRTIRLLVIFGGVCALAGTASAQKTCSNTVILRTQAEIDAFDCSELTGLAALYLHAGGQGIDLSPLSVLRSVGGFVSIQNIQATSLVGLEGLSTIGQYLLITNNPGLTSLEGLSGLDTTGGGLVIRANPSLTSLSGLGTVSIGGSFVVEGSAVTTLSGAENIQAIAGGIRIAGTTSLTSVGSLQGIGTIGGDLDVYDNRVLASLSGLGLTSVGGNVSITLNDSLTSLAGLGGLTEIGGDLLLDVNGLTSLEGLEGLTHVGGRLSVYNNNALSSIESLEQLRVVGGDLTIAFNPRLVECACPLAGLISDGVFSGVGGEVQISGNASTSNGGRCNSPQEVLANPCERDCRLDWENAAGGAFADSTNWKYALNPANYSSADECHVWFDTGDPAGYLVTFDYGYSSASLGIGRDLVTFDLDGRVYRAEPASAAGPSIVIGTTSGETGSFLITNGTVASGGGIVGIGLDGGTGSLVVSSGGHVRVPESAGDVAYLQVGQMAESTGSLIVEDGGTLNTSWIVTIGEESDATGEVFIQGDGSRWDARSVTVGLGGAGSLTIQEGGRVETTFFSAGREGESSADILISGNGSILDLPDAGELILGVEGDAELIIEAGGELTQGSGQVTVMGSKKGSTGTAILKGTGSRWTSDGPVGIGGDGVGTLSVEDGAEVSFPSMVLAVTDEASTTESVGVVHVSGEKSKLSLTFGDADAIISRGGTGIVHVSDRAKLAVAANLVVGGDPGDRPPGDGTLEVEGHGSTLEVHGGLVLGARTRGLASILDGGYAGAEEVWVGFLDRQPRVVSRMLVDGIGSTLQTERLIVGGGTGTMMVTNGGHVRTFAVSLAHEVGPFGEPASGFLDVRGQFSTLIADRIQVGAGGSGSLTARDGGLVRAGLIQVYGDGEADGTGGTLDAPVVEVGGPSSGKQGGTDGGAGIVVDTLFVARGAVLDADTVIFNVGGVLGGSHAWPFPILNRGTISPGESVGRTGTFTAIAGYAQAPEGVLTIELAGPGDGEYDRLEVSGTATLGGTLRLSVVDGYRPGKGERFEILTAGSVVGTFERIEGPEGIWVALTYGDTAVEVEILTGVAIEEDPLAPEELPQSYALEQNYPNPFNPSTEIVFAMPEASEVRLVVHDLMGREVARLVEGALPPGTHRVTFDAGNLASGTYLYRIEAGAFRAVRRAVLTK